MSEKCATLEHEVPGIVWGLQKKFGGQKWKKYGLPSVKKWHSAKEHLFQVLGEDTRQRSLFAEC